MIKLGITGGIGSGKSVVADLFRLYGVPVYIADLEAKKLVNTSPAIRKQLTTLFGNDLYSDTGVNKQKLAGYIFGNPQLMQTVNGIIHPEVGRHFVAWTEQQKGKLCAIESAILFESGFDALVDKTLSVFADEATRIRRAAERDQTSEAAIRQRIKHQMPDELKKERADFVIYNHPHTALIPQVRTLIDTLQA